MRARNRWISCLMLGATACGGQQVSQARLDAHLQAHRCDVHPIVATHDADKHRVRLEAPMLARLADHPGEAGVTHLITQVAILGAGLSRGSLSLEPERGEVHLRLTLDAHEGVSDTALLRATSELCQDAVRLLPLLRPADG